MFPGSMVSPAYLHVWDPHEGDVTADTLCTDYLLWKHFLEGLDLEGRSHLAIGLIVNDPVIELKCLNFGRNTVCMKS